MSSPCYAGAKPLNAQCSQDKECTSGSCNQATKKCEPVSIAPRARAHITTNTVWCSAIVDMNLMPPFPLQFCLASNPLLFIIHMQAAWPLAQIAPWLAIVALAIANWWRKPPPRNVSPYHLRLGHGCYLEACSWCSGALQPHHTLSMHRPAGASPASHHSAPGHTCSVDPLLNETTSPSTPTCLCVWHAIAGPLPNGSGCAQGGLPDPSCMSGFCGGLYPNFKCENVHAG